MHTARCIQDGAHNDDFERIIWAKLFNSVHEYTRDVGITVAICGIFSSSPLTEKLSKNILHAGHLCRRVANHPDVLGGYRHPTGLTTEDFLHVRHHQRSLGFIVVVIWVAETFHNHRILRKRHGRIRGVEYYWEHDATILARDQAWGGHSVARVFKTTRRSTQQTRLKLARVE